MVATAVLSLGIGIGLNSAAFSVVDQCAFQALPVFQAERLYHLDAESGRMGFSYRDRLEFASQKRTIESVAAEQDEVVIANHKELPVELHAKIVSPNYFTVLGVRPQLGRLFSESDSPDSQTPPEVVVISDGLWTREFGRDPGILGTQIHFSGRAVTLIGILPKGFTGTSRWMPPELWIPAECWHSKSPRSRTAGLGGEYHLLVRLMAGVTAQQASAEAEVVVRRLAEIHSSLPLERRARLSPVVAPRTTQVYLSALGALVLPGLVLALACANVSALLTARAQTRAGEIAVRLALGSSRRRLIGLLLAESLLLATAGGVAGLLLAGWTLHALPSLLPSFGPQMLPSFQLNGKLVAISGMLSFLAVVLSGLTPALSASKAELTPVLKSSVPSIIHGRRFSGLNRLVIGQITVSIVLLNISGLFLHSLLQGLWSQGAFKQRNVLLVELSPSQYGIPDQQLANYASQALDSLRTLPGVEQVSLTGTAPANPDEARRRTIFLSSEGSGAGQRLPAIAWNTAAPGIFPTLGLRTLLGSDFSLNADSNSVLVSQTAANVFWQGQSPVGKTIQLDSLDGKRLHVIGVVEDGQYNQKNGVSQPYLFLPITAVLPRVFVVLLRTRGDPRGFTRPAIHELRRVHPAVLPTRIETWDEHIRSSYSMVGRRFNARLFGCFGLVGLWLAAVGLYGVTSHTVGCRTREFGIRLAVGADRFQILGQVLREGLRMGLMGVFIAAPLAFASAQLLRSSLYGLNPLSPGTFTLVSIVLVAVTLGASLIPALRASRTSPLEALRCN